MEPTFSVGSHTARTSSPDTFTAGWAFTEPPTFPPFVETKEANPINFLIPSSSSVLPLKSSSVIWSSLLVASFFSSPLLYFGWEGEGDVGLGRLVCLEWRLPWSLPQNWDPSQLARSLSWDWTGAACLPLPGAAAALLGLFKELKHLEEISEWFTENETWKISQLSTAGKKGYI